jgi:flagellar motor switch protein FliG
MSTAAALEQQLKPDRKPAKAEQGKLAVPYADVTSLRGIQKCAVLMVAMGEDKAAEIFKHLSQTEVEALSLEIAKAPKVPSDVVKGVVNEVVETVLAEDFLAEGGVDYARSLLRKSLGADRADEIISRLAATIERRPFEFLRRTPPEQIHVFLRNESPQTIALVVANLHTALAAQVLSLLDPEEQADVAARVAQMGETRPEVVAQIESVMKQKLSNVIAQEYSSAGGVKSLADILNQADRSTERNVLDQLAQTNGELAEEVRLLLFTFEDVVKLDDRSIQMVLKEVDQKDLAIALRGVSDDVKHRIFSNMSERGAELLKEEIDFQPPQRRRVIEESQGRIVGVVRRLEEAGAVVISRGAGGGDDERM